MGGGNIESQRASGAAHGPRLKRRFKSKRCNSMVGDHRTIGYAEQNRTAQGRWIAMGMNRMESFLFSVLFAYLMLGHRFAVHRRILLPCFP